MLPPGQLMLDLSGVQLSPEESEILLHPAVGGVLLFTRNYQDPEQMRTLVSSIRALRPQLLVAVDQEGGRVQRFRHGLTRLPALQVAGRVAAAFGMSEARRFSGYLGYLMASEILKLGLDLSLAPVLDIDENHSQAISNRAFSNNPDWTISLGRAYMQGMAAAGMAATAKHFPGHGGATADSHEELPVDCRNLDEIWRCDLRPFGTLHHLYDGLMCAHLLFPEVDDVPVTFSTRWIGDILREEVGFDGLVFSDDLSMGAVREYIVSDRIDRSLEAGCDMLILCNDRAAAIEALRHLHSHHSPQPELQKRLARMRPRRRRTPASRRTAHHSRAHAMLRKYRDFATAEFRDAVV